MTLKPDLNPDGMQTFDVMTVASEILSEGCDMAYPSLAELVDFLLDHWPVQATVQDT